jgi:ABC-type Mn2+/Zn2+ transport system ATPase subunit
MDLWAGYDATPALEGVGVEIPAGTLVGLAGPNGSGKSTLLKAILNIVRLWRGSVEVFGQPINHVRPRVAYAPQIDATDWDFPASVYDVVMMGRYGRLGLLRRPGPIDRQAVDHALQQVSLDGLASRQPRELSGGQQRRVLIARALAQEADLLLFDEPMAGLDAPSQHELLTLFERLRNEGQTLIVATHDLSCVAACFDLALLLNRTVIAFGTPQDVLKPDILTEAYAEHLLLLPTEGGVLVGHHGHG